MKKLLVEVIGVVVFLGGAFYLYKISKKIALSKTNISYIQATPAASPSDIDSPTSMGILSEKSDKALAIKKDNKSYKVLIDRNTELKDRDGGKTSLLEFQVGDTLDIIGNWTDESQTIIVANMVRDLSIQKSK